MAIESDGKIRIEFTREELAYLLAMVWEKLKKEPSAAAADWRLVRLLAILRKGLRPLPSTLAGAAGQVMHETRTPEPSTRTNGAPVAHGNAQRG